MENTEIRLAAIGLDPQLPAGTLPEPAKKLGRPDEYSPEIADKVCDEVASTNKTIQEICDQLGINRRTLNRWLRKNPEFQEEYIIARWCRVENLADECIAIADDGSRDFKEEQNEDGTTSVVLNKETLGRAAMRLTERHLMLNKFWPRRYGNTPAEYPEIPGVTSVESHTDARENRSPVIDLLAEEYAKRGITVMK